MTTKIPHFVYFKFTLLQKIITIFGIYIKSGKYDNNQTIL